MTPYDFTVRTLGGRQASIAEYRGKVLVIVNTASECGYTPQYEGLEKLYQEFRDRGLVVLGFPCNQFGQQEPGGDAEIAQFCSVKYGVTFPMFSKIEVNGANAEPLFEFLKRERRGVLGTSRIKWNFTKFLVDRQGRVVRRFGPRRTPAELRPAIEQLL